MAASRLARKEMKDYDRSGKMRRQWKRDMTACLENHSRYGDEVRVRQLTSSINITDFDCNDSTSDPDLYA